MPSPISVKALIMALPFSDSVMTAPPVVTLLPNASIACTVIVDVEIPSAAMELREVEIVVCAVVATPGVNVTVPVSAIGTPSSVPLMVIISVTVFVIVAV